MRKNIRGFVIMATIALAGVPLLAGCVVVPGYHAYWHGHYVWHR